MLGWPPCSDPIPPCIWYESVQQRKPARARASRPDEKRATVGAGTTWFTPHIPTSVTLQENISLQNEYFTFAVRVAVMYTNCLAG